MAGTPQPLRTGWWDRLLKDISLRRYTGPVILHCVEGQIRKIEERRVREPQDFSETASLSAK